MSERAILIKALKAEAKMKPDEKIKIGWRFFTYEEFAEILDSRGNPSNEEKGLLESFIDNALKMFRENPVYRQKMMALAGVT